MRRLVVTILSIFLLAAPALALPAPMSKSELLLKSDLVALVRINSVTCVSVTKDEATGEELPSWTARAELIEMIKGEEVKGDSVTISFHAIPTGLLGPWTVYYYPGEMLWTHLTGKDGAYTSTWWNARGTLVSKAVVDTLPTTPGETVSIPKRDQ
jgi:hypothetical protein